MRKKRVLQVSTTTLQYDGLTKVLFSLIDNCDASTYQNEIVLGKGAIDPFIKDLKIKKIEFYEPPDREYKPLSYYWNIIKIIVNGKYDVIHVHGNSATMAIELIIALFFGVKTRIAHSHNTATNHPIIHKFLKPLLNIVTTHPVACSKEAGVFLFSNRKVTIIPNCIDVDKFKFDEKKRIMVRDKLNYNKDDFVIGHVGRFRHQKNHNYLIRLFNEYHKQNNNARLFLIGEDDGREGTRNKIEDLVDELDLKEFVFFYGTSDSVFELYQAMDCFVLPSHYEGFGITAIEAQANGLTCLLSDQIPHDVQMIDRCFFLPLVDDYQAWCIQLDIAKTLHGNREKYAKIVSDAGYDIKNLPKKIDEVWN